MPLALLLRRLTNNQNLEFVEYTNIGTLQKALTADRNSVYSPTIIFI